MLKHVQAEKEAEDLCGLRHRVFLPAAGRAKSDACVLLLHGRSGDCSSMWPFSKTLQSVSPLTIAPEGPSKDSLGGYSWWPLEDGDTDKHSYLELAQAKFPPALERLERFIETLPALYGANTERLFGVGFSQGAGLLSIAAVARPELFSGIALLSGFVPRAVQNDALLISEAARSQTAALPEVFIAHGSADRIVPLERARAAEAFFEKLGASVSFHEEPVGHKVGPQGVKALEMWLEERLLMYAGK